MSLRYHILIELDETINGTLPDLKGGQVRQEIIAHKEAHEHPVINGSLYVELISGRHDKDSPPPDRRGMAGRGWSAPSPDTALFSKQIIQHIKCKKNNKYT